MGAPWIGRVNESGRIDWTQPRLVQSWLLKRPGRHIRAKVVPISERSAQQIGYWFAVPVSRVAKHTGYTEAQTHVLLVMNCFGVIHDKVTGRQVPVQASTSMLTTTHMATLIEWVRPWAKKTYGLDLPAPWNVAPADIEDGEPS